ncbi:MAG: MFS transporter [Anaerolineae bacterium]|nr:MFS transporter [Anaerolineae bacterium]
MAGYVQMLRSNPGFARLWLAQVVSLMGDWFNLIVLSALVAEYSGGSGPAVSLLVVARVLPPFFISPVAGVLADRFDRRRLLIFSDLARAGVVLAYLLATGPEALWLIYALTVLQFSLSAIFWPAQSALIPSLVPHSDLVRANTLGSITWSMMLAVGAVLGGLVASLVGPVAALITDSATFVVSALFIGAIRAPHYVAETAPDAATPPAAPAVAPSDRGLREGLRYALAHPTTAATLLVKAGLGIVGADTLIVIYGTDVFRLGKDGTGSIGILYATYGVGAVLGPLLFNRVNDGSVRVMRRLIAGGSWW